MIDQIHIVNYKCLKDKVINFRNLTVLCGSNSVGKTSVIQILLLTKIASDRSNKFAGTNLKSLNIPLNGYFGLNLGNTKEVLTRDASNNNIIFNIIDKTNKLNLFLNFKAEDKYESQYDLELLVDPNIINQTGIFNNDLYYLSAERIGPRLSYDAEQQDYPHVGFQGEFTSQILSQKKEEPIFNKDKRAFSGVQDFKLLTQVREWMKFIIPGFYLDDAKLEGKLKKTHITFDKSSPPNVGFGISYVLPIVVNGLIAKEGSLFIVENPEAHLHPKGQSNIGWFLAIIAFSGVQVIVETHSEHIINGMRKAILFLNNLSTEEIIINFFLQIDDNKNAVTSEIFVAKSGDLTSFPKDFFDQVNQDLGDIFKLRNTAKDG